MRTLMYTWPMSTSPVTESTVIQVGDRVQLGRTSPNLWLVTYVHGDGNLTLVRAKACRRYVHPSQLASVFDKEI